MTATISSATTNSNQYPLDTASTTPTATPAKTSSTDSTTALANVMKEASTLEAQVKAADFGKDPMGAIVQILVGLMKTFMELLGAFTNQSSQTATGSNGASSSSSSQGVGTTTGSTSSSGSQQTQSNSSTQPSGTTSASTSTGSGSTGSTSDTAKTQRPVGGLQALTDEKGAISVVTDDGYTLKTEGKDQAWNIIGPDGKSTRIWGDPHVWESDGDKWDFKDKSTFKFGNNKVTVETVPAGNGETFTSRITVYSGIERVTIDGIDTNKPALRAAADDAIQHDASLDDGDLYERGLDARGEVWAKIKGREHTIQAAPAQGAKAA